MSHSHGSEEMPEQNMFARSSRLRGESAGERLCWQVATRGRLSARELALCLLIR